MTGIAITGAQSELNHLTGVATPVISGTAPTWFPGLQWVNTTTNPPVLYLWNGVAWAPIGGGPYLALLTSDPTNQTTIAGLTECQDAGYARQAVTFTQASATAPVSASNTALIAFGPFSVNMALPVQWIALVTTQSGTNGFLRETWTLSAPEQVLASQTIDIPANALVITQQ
jgi:hypothetical protein